MRILPSRYMAQAKPVLIKKQRAQLQHVQAPLKGLSIYSKLTTSDPLLAPVLDNFIVEEDRITCRAGTLLRMTHADAKPIFCLVPFYGAPEQLAAATNGKLVNITTGDTIRDGFTSDDWHWTSFSNLSDKDYTVMVNGHDGVWSWDGGETLPSAPIPIVTVSKANPAVVTIGAADIGLIYEGATIYIAGATGDFAVVNGHHKATSVGTPVNSFSLPGVDTSGATGTSPAGMTVIVQGSVAPELVKAPATKPYIVPDQFQIVVSHMNRLWFADSTNLALYYLPLQQKSGELKELPLNAIFKRGGSIRAVYTWTVDGGMGLDDQLVIFSSNGEAAIYNGTDPDTVGDMKLTGVFRFDSPMSKHSVINYGGELYCLISTGLVPMSTLIRAESEQLGKQDRTVFSLFADTALTMRDRPGWSVILNHSSGRIICNQPLGSPNSYRQLVRFMPNPIWATWSKLPARCWGWVDNRMFFGSDDGKVYEMSPIYLNDNGQPITTDVQAGWSLYKTPANKHFKMIKAYTITDGVPRPYLDMRVDYDATAPSNQPDVTEGALGSEWDVSDWDDADTIGADWAHAEVRQTNWTGVAALGRVGAPRMVTAVRNCTFSITGWDVLYENGSVL